MKNFLILTQKEQIFQTKELLMLPRQKNCFLNETIFYSYPNKAIFQTKKLSDDY